jgi:hypothetical protein
MILKGVSSEMYLDRDWTLKLGTEKLCYRKNIFFKFKGTPSREENVFTIIEMNLLVESTNPPNDGLPAFN